MNLLSRIVSLLGFVCLVPASQAVIHITFSEIGDDVVASFSGSLDTTGLTNFGTFGVSNVTRIDHDEFRSNPGLVGGADIYGNATTSIGWIAAPVPEVSGTGSGDYFELRAGVGGGEVYLPTGYSGATLTGSATFANQTFSSIGLGDYSSGLVLSWSNDSVTFSLTEMPEPSTYATILGVACLGMVAWRRRQA